MTTNTRRETASHREGHIHLPGYNREDACVRSCSPQALVPVTTISVACKLGNWDFDGNRLNNEDSSSHFTNFSKLASPPEKLPVRVLVRLSVSACRRRLSAVTSKIFAVSWSRPLVQGSRKFTLFFLVHNLALARTRVCESL